MIYLWTLLGFLFIFAATGAGFFHQRRGWSRGAAIGYALVCLALGLFCLLFLRR